VVDPSNVVVEVVETDEVVTVVVAGARIVSANRPTTRYDVDADGFAMFMYAPRIHTLPTFEFGAVHTICGEAQHFCNLPVEPPQQL